MESLNQGTHPPLPHPPHQTRPSWGEGDPGLPRVGEKSGKNKIISRSGNCQGILKKCQGIFRVATCQGKVREKQNFLQVRELSGNFEKMSGNFSHLTNVREMSGNFVMTIKFF